MAALTGTDPNVTYADLLQLGSGVGSGMTSSFQNAQDGLGNSCPLQLKTTGVNIQSGFTYNSHTVSFGGNFATGSTFSTTGTFSTGGNFSTSSTASITGALSIGAALTTTGAFTVAASGTPTLTLSGSATISTTPITKVVVRVITSTGTYTPTTGMVYCIVEGVGGGGGSGGCALTGAGFACSSGSGAGGTYSRVRLTAAQVGASQTATIGAAGAAATAGANSGGSGGTTSLGTLLTAPGGGGGGGGSAQNTSLTYSSTGGAHGATGTGDISIPGQNGTGGQLGAIAGYGLSNAGGSSLLGFGNRNVDVVALSTGTNYGGGAAGVNIPESTSATAGTAGNPGVLIITEYVAV